MPITEVIELDDLWYIGMWCTNGQDYGSVNMQVIYSDCVAALVLDNSTLYYEGYIVMKFSQN